MSLIGNYARALSAFECADQIKVDGKDAIVSASKLTYKPDNVVFHILWNTDAGDRHTGKARITERGLAEAKFFAHRMTVRDADDKPVAIELYSHVPCTY